MRKTNGNRYSSLFFPSRKENERFLLGSVDISAQPYQTSYNAINNEKLRADLSNRERIRLKYLTLEKKHSTLCRSL